MSEKSIKSRIIHKHDTELNWNKAVNFIPLKGELIVYDVDDTHTQERFKIGDGVNLVTNLPFVNNSSNINTSYLGGNNTNGIIKGFRFTKVTKDYDYQYNTHTSKKLEDGVNYGTYTEPIQTIKMYVDSIEGINATNPYPVYSIFGFDKNGEPDRIHRGFITGTGTDDNGNYVILQTQSGEGALYKIFDDLANSYNQEYGENSIVMALIIEGGTIGSFEVVDDLNYFSQYTEGYKTTAGVNAHAGGNESKALGYSSFATGNKSVARGERGFAINYKTEANGMETFAANDQTKANGKGAFATGEKTEANGNYSFTDGSKTTAIGDYSRASGVGSEARGVGASAEGDNTKASSAYQHVQGKHNIEDAEDKYAHIVGNGHITEEGEIIKRNAHTVDWEGMGWFANGVKVGGMSQDDGEYLVTESDLNYVENQLNDKVNNKVDTDTFNTKVTELQTSIDSKADNSSITSLQTEISKKANATDVTNLQTELNKKANAEDIFPKNITPTVSGNITGDKRTSLNNDTIISENDIVANYLEDGRVSFKTLADGNGVQTQNYPKLKVPIESLTLQPGTYSKTASYNTSVFKRLAMCGYYVNFITDEAKNSGNIIENQDTVIITDSITLTYIEVKTDYASGQWGAATQLVDEGYLEIDIVYITDITSDLIGAGTKQDIDRIDEEILNKADKSEVYTKSEIETELNKKANKTTTDDLINQLNKKVDKSDITNVYKFKGSVDNFEGLPFKYKVIPNGEPTFDGEVCGTFSSSSKTIYINNLEMEEFQSIRIPIEPITIPKGYTYNTTMEDDIFNIIWGTEEAFNNNWYNVVYKHEEERTLNYIDLIWINNGLLEDQPITYSGDITKYISEIYIVPESYIDTETESPDDPSGRYFDSNGLVNQGDVYNVLDTDMNYAWTGTGWDALGGEHKDVEAREQIDEITLDLDNKANKSDIPPGKISTGINSVTFASSTNEFSNVALPEQVYYKPIVEEFYEYISTGKMFSHGAFHSTYIDYYGLFGFYPSESLKAGDICLLTFVCDDYHYQGYIKLTSVSDNVEDANHIIEGGYISFNYISELPDMNLIYSTENFNLSVVNKCIKFENLTFTTNPSDTSLEKLYTYQDKWDNKCYTIYQDYAPDIADGTTNDLNGNPLVSAVTEVAEDDEMLTAIKYEALFNEGIYFAVSDGDNSLSSGNNTVAIGNEAVAMGNLTISLGDRSTAIGRKILVRGATASAFGINNKVTGRYAMSFNEGGRAIGYASLTFGDHCNAYDYYDVAGGFHSVAKGNTSFAYGRKAEASAMGAVAFGQNTQAMGQWCLVGGNANKSSGIASLVYGLYNNVSGDYSMVAGQSNTVTGTASLVSGYNNNVSGTTSFAIGNNNTLSGNNGATVFGHHNNVSSNGSVVLGSNNDLMIDSDNSLISGSANNVKGRNNIIGGSSNNISNGSNNITSGASNSVSDSSYVGVFGSNNIATSASRSIIGGMNNVVSGNNNNLIGYANTVTGEANIVGGTNNGITGHRNLAIGTVNSLQCNSSFALGLQHTVTADNSLVAGQENSLHGEWLSVFGYNNSVSGSGSIVSGTHNVSKTSDDNIIAGSRNTSNNSYNALFGFKLESNMDYQTIVGKHNVLRDDALFIVGNGEWEDNSNAMVVTSDGKIESTNDMIVTKPGAGIILASPNGTKYKLTVSDSGAFAVEGVD